MINNSSELSNQSNPDPSKKLVYHKPEFVSLGSLERVQGSYRGRNYDGPDGRYYYYSKK